MREDDWLPIDDAAKQMERVLLRYRPRCGHGEGLVVAGNWDEDQFARKPVPHWTNDLAIAYGRTWVKQNQPTHYQPIVGPKLKREGA